MSKGPLNRQSLFSAIGFLRKAFFGYKWPVVLLLVLSFVSSLLEGLGINSIIPLFSILDPDNAGADAISAVTKQVFVSLHLAYTVKNILIFIVLLFVIKALLSLALLYYSAVLTFRYEQRVRSELLDKTFKSQWSFLVKQKAGQLEQFLTVDINRASSLIVFFVSSLTLFSSLLVYSLLVINISWIIALFTFCFGIFVLFVFNPLFSRSRLWSRQVGGLYKEIAHQVAQGIWGMKVVKAMAAETRVTARVQLFFEQIRRLNIKIATLKNGTSVVLQVLGIIFVLGIFVWFYKTQSFYFASFAVVIYAINKVFNSLQTLQGQIYQINEILPYLSAIETYRSQIESVSEKHAGNKPFVFKEQLVLETVQFGYRPDQLILKDIDLMIKKGEMIGLVGASGSGKTTLADLLLQLYHPTSGRITIDGVDVGEIRLPEWRSRVGYVAQEPFLYNDSIKNNITFYNGAVTEAELIEVAKAANIYEFIKELPETFDTIIGDRGVFLSVGQRQRIVFARVLLRKPEVLLLDEATSALDNESEAFIAQTIQKLRGQITIIAIAHRLSTVMAADKIVVLEKGVIVEQGIPQTLLSRTDSYFYKAFNQSAPRSS